MSKATHRIKNWFEYQKICKGRSSPLEWFKIVHDMPNDMHVSKLSDRLFRSLMNCLCYCHHPSGEIRLSEEEISHRAKCKPFKFRELDHFIVPMLHDVTMCNGVQQDATERNEAQPRVEESRVEERRVDLNTIDHSDSDFEEFWNIYPKKVGKKTAGKSWSRIRFKGDMLDILYSALREQVKSKQWQYEGGKYIPNPTTWLNQERWNDEVEKIVDISEDTGETGGEF